MSRSTATAGGSAFQRSDTHLTLISVAYVNVDNMKRLAGKSTHELRFCQDMPFARLQHASFSCARLQIKDDI